MARKDLFATPGISPVKTTVVSAVVELGMAFLTYHPPPALGLLVPADRQGFPKQRPLPNSLECLSLFLLNHSA